MLTSLPLQLADFDGLEAARMVSVLGGNADAYVDLLRQFAADHHNDARQIRDDLAAGRIESAEQRIHMLKGAAATMGATALYVSAVALEQIMRSDELTEKASPLLETLQEAQSALERVLAHLPEAPGAAERQPDDLGRVRALLEQLEPLLAADDTAACDLIERNRPLLLAALGIGATRLGRQMASFDFPAALTTLRELLAKYQAQEVNS